MLKFSCKRARMLLAMLLVLLAGAANKARRWRQNKNRQLKPTVCISLISIFPRIASQY